MFSRTKHGADRIARKLERRRHRDRDAAFEPHAGPAPAGAQAIQVRRRARADRHRHRRARHRRRRHLARHQLRLPAAAGRLRAPHRPHRPRQAIGDAISFVTHDDADNLAARTVPRPRHHAQEARRLRRAVAAGRARLARGYDADRRPPRISGPPRSAPRGRGKSKGPRSGTFGPNAIWANGAAGRKAAAAAPRHARRATTVHDCNSLSR